jgi:4-amino-4-deoxy-L-arabinose transferase-like glycosyltransferase
VESPSTDGVTLSSAPLKLTPLSFRLIACAMALGSLALLALASLDHVAAASGLTVAGFALMALAAGYPRVGNERWQTAFERYGPLLYLSVPLGASALVAIAAEMEPQLSAYGWWLALWLGTMASVPPLLGLRVRPRAAADFLRRHRWEVALVVVLTAGGAIARVVQLSSLPYPYAGDEATFALGGINVIEGAVVNPYRFAVHGAPTMFFFYVAGFQRLFGDSMEVARLASVVLGVAAVPVTYLFLRELFHRNVAIAGTLFLAAFHFHIQFSRQSMPNIIDPVYIPFVLLFAYRAMKYGRRLDYAVAGLAVGFTIYTWVSARLVPLEVAALAGWWVVAHRRMPVNWLEGGAIAIVAAVIAALPLGLHAYNNPDGFSARVNAVYIHGSPADGLSWYENERQTGRSAFDIYWTQAKDSFGAVMFTRDQKNFYGADIPLIGTMAIVPLAIGLFWATWRIREPRYFLLLVMFTAPIVAGGILTNPPISSARLLGTIPAIAALVGIGAERVGWLTAGRRPPLYTLVTVAVIVPIAIASLNFYFRIYDSQGYSDHVTVQIDMFNERVQEEVPEGTRVNWIITDVWNTGHPALMFGVRNYPVTTYDENGISVSHANPRRLPLDSPQVAYLLVGERSEDLEGVMEQCPGGSVAGTDDDSIPGLSYAIYTVDADTIPEAQETLDGRTVDPCVAPGD